MKGSQPVEADGLHRLLGQCIRQVARLVLGELDARVALRLRADRVDDGVRAAARR